MRVEIIFKSATDVQDTEPVVFNDVASTSFTDSLYFIQQLRNGERIDRWFALDTISIRSEFHKGED